jgi:hypothetical protein
MLIYLPGRLNRPRLAFTGKASKFRWLVEAVVEWEDGTKRVRGTVDTVGMVGVSIGSSFLLPVLCLYYANSYRHRNIPSSLVPAIRPGYTKYARGTRSMPGVHEVCLGYTQYAWGTRPYARVG